MNPPDEVLTVQELARYLRMQPLTIYKHASVGKLPGFKIVSHWRFKKSTIGQWIQSQENQNGNFALRAAHKQNFPSIVAEFH